MPPCLPSSLCLTLTAVWFGTASAFACPLTVRTDRTYVAGLAACRRGPGRISPGGGGGTLIYRRRVPSSGWWPWLVAWKIFP